MMKRYVLVSNDDSVRSVGEDFHMRNVAGHTSMNIDFGDLEVRAVNL